MVMLGISSKLLLIEAGVKMSAAGSEGIGPKKIGPETYEGRFELSARV